MFKAGITLYISRILRVGRTFKAGIIFLIIISFFVSGALIVSIMGVFGLSGYPWDWLRGYINWNWLKEYQAFVAGSVGVFLLLWAAVVAMFQLRAAGRTRYADLLSRLSVEWNSDSFIESRYLMMQLAPIRLEEKEQRHRVTKRMKMVEQQGNKDYFLLTRPLDFFEELAFLIRQKYIPLEDARRTFGGPMVYYYNVFEDYIKEMRQSPGDEGAYKELEYVVKQLMA